MSALYVFALTREVAAPFEFDGHEIEFVGFRGLGAAVERVAERPQLSEAALRTQHEIVMRIATYVDDLLPARFGAFVDDRELEEILAIRREVVQEALDLVHGRVQMTIRIRDGASPAGRPDVAPSGAATSGTAYLEARRAAAVHTVPPGAASMTAAVRHLVAAERSENGQGRSAASIYHLIERRHVNQYRAALSSVQSSIVTVSGPWPPFAFTPDFWP
jgi:hypothetical protein